MLSVQEVMLIIIWLELNSDFYKMDQNDVEDLGLWEQNKNMDYYKNL